MGGTSASRQSRTEACCVVVPVPRFLGRRYSGVRRTRKTPAGTSSTRSTYDSTSGPANAERRRSSLAASEATLP
ncbi:Uncharacterised protein [Mycobacteroides abscessus]|nr:Uncharacterised protein [Mycobacteroides abscessus]